MDQDNRNRNENVFSTKIRAGRRRTYFFDVRTTKSNDYYLTITESKKKSTGDGYERHKIFLYKEDFNKFLEEMTIAIDYIKERMPDFDFDAFKHQYDDEYQDEGNQKKANPSTDLSETLKSYESSSEKAPSQEERAELMDDPRESDQPPSPPSIDPSINEDDLKW